MIARSNYPQCVAGLLAGAAFLLAPAGAGAADAYTACRPALDAEESAVFIACANPLMEQARDALANARARRDEADALATRAAAQLAPQAVAACAGARVTAAELERDITRLRQIDRELQAMRDQWRDAAGGLSQARAAKQYSLNALMLIAYAGLWQTISTEADSLSRDVRATANQLVQTDVDSLCAGVPAPGSATASFAIAAVEAPGEINNNGPRQDVTVVYSGTPSFPVTVILKPARTPCVEPPPPTSWSCATEERRFAVAPANRRLVMAGAAWCSGAPRGRWTTYYEVVLRDSRGQLSQAVATTSVCVAE